MQTWFGVKKIKKKNREKNFINSKSYCQGVIVKWLEGLGYGAESRRKY